eukprot:gene22382-30633_t
MRKAVFIGVFLVFLIVDAFKFSRISKPSQRDVYFSARSTFVDEDLSSSIEVLKDSLKKNVASLNTGGWFPVGPVNTFDDKLPFDITIASTKLAVWRNPLDKDNALTGGWSVMLDVCPHRLAPLSQGRVDMKSGCLECPYHGWQFESGGTCTRIPQLPKEELPSLSNPKSSASSLPAYLLSGILWTFVPLPAGPASYFPQLPDELVPQTKLPLTNAVIRDFYYSYDFLVENFFDIAHIPFAHHTLQSTRADGAPLNITLLTDLSNSTHLEVQYGDIMRGRPREGVMSFSPPSIYTLKTRFADVPNQLFKPTLTLYVMPVEPGKSRAIIGSSFPMKGILKLIFQPWLLHILSNRFVDSDLWVHDQEVAARKVLDSSTTVAEGQLDDSSEPLGTEDAKKPRQLRTLRPLLPKYALIASQGDVGVTSWRNFWVKSGMAASPVFGPYFNAPQVHHSKQADRYEGHVKYCKICQSALKNAVRVNRWSILLALLPTVFNAALWLRGLGVALFCAAQVISTKIINGLNGSIRGDKLTAAQFAPDDKEKRRK